MATHVIYSFSIFFEHFTIAGHSLRRRYQIETTMQIFFPSFFFSIDAIDEFRAKHFDGGDGDGNDGGGGLYTALKIVRKWSMFIA